MHMRPVNTQRGIIHNKHFNFWGSLLRMDCYIFPELSTAMTRTGGCCQPHASYTDEYVVCRNTATCFSNESGGSA